MTADKVDALCGLVILRGEAVRPSQIITVCRDGRRQHAASPAAGARAHLAPFAAHRHLDHTWTGRVSRVDPKFDRKEGLLTIREFWWEPKIVLQRGLESLPTAKMAARTTL
jgi:hypothetical protein